MRMKWMKAFCYFHKTPCVALFTRVASCCWLLPARGSVVHVRLRYVMYEGALPTLPLQAELPCACARGVRFLSVSSSRVYNSNV